MDTLSVKAVKAWLPLIVGFNTQARKTPLQELTVICYSALTTSQARLAITVGI